MRKQFLKIDYYFEKAIILNDYIVKIYKQYFLTKKPVALFSNANLKIQNSMKKIMSRFFKIKNRNVNFKVQNTAVGFPLFVLFFLIKKSFCRGDYPF